MASHGLDALHHTFVVPRPLTQSGPRDVDLTSAGRALMVVAVLLFGASIAGGALLHGEAARQARDRRALVEDGVFVQGRVTRLWADGDNRRRVEYAFDAGGRSFAGRTRLSTERRRTLQVGSPVAVRYVPSTPAVNDLGGPARDGLPAWMPMLAAGILAVAGALCLWPIARQRRLLSDGRVAPAVVTAHHQRRTQHGTERSLTLEFALPSGAVVTSRRGMSRHPPPVGTVICVVYDPDRPSRNGIYPLRLVRPVT